MLQPQRRRIWRSASACGNLTGIGIPGKMEDASMTLNHALLDRLGPDQLVPWLQDAVHLAAARMHDRSAAEDAVQEACVDAIRSASRFRGTYSQARAWFLT